jgi:hypothetical protein
MALIQYVGKQPRKIDNVLHTGRVWQGAGDIIEVPDAEAAVYCGYPDQFALAESGDSGEETNAPTDEGERIEAIRGAIDELDEDDEDAFTAAGKPQVSALQAVLGYDISAAERDQALEPEA